jgi:hypothetical protein
MPGIYNRDNIAAILSGGLQNALNRRDAYEKERQARVQSNVDALKGFINTTARTVDDWLAESPEDKLARLKQEYSEALAAERDAYNNSVREAVGANQPSYASNPYLTGMEGYKPNYSVDGYSKFMGSVSPDYNMSLMQGIYRRGR